MRLLLAGLALLLGILLPMIPSLRAALCALGAALQGVFSLISAAGSR
jgi:hypothetical protein